MEPRCGKQDGKGALRSRYEALAPSETLGWARGVSDRGAGSAPFWWDLVHLVEAKLKGGFSGPVVFCSCFLGRFLVLLFALTKIDWI